MMIIVWVLVIIMLVNGDGNGNGHDDRMVGSNDSMNDDNDNSVGSGYYVGEWRW